MLNQKPNSDLAVFSSIAILAISGFILINSGFFSPDSLRLVAAVVAGVDTATKADPRTLYIDATLDNNIVTDSSSPGYGNVGPKTLKALNASSSVGVQ